VGPEPLIVEQNREAISELARTHKAVLVAVFGSVARGDDTSNIDFLVKFEPGS